MVHAAPGTLRVLDWRKEKLADNGQRQVEEGVQRMFSRNTDWRKKELAGAGRLQVEEGAQIKFSRSRDWREPAPHQRDLGKVAHWKTAAGAQGH